jgi:UDP-glucose:(heptosyl)LPS alpha-1,3-glucosyltransferase
VKLALVRARYNPFGGAERFLNDAVASLAPSQPPVAITLFTREWPAQASSAMSHRIINPGYVSSTGRDRGFARAVGAALATESFDLVQSYERCNFANIYHAVDGVHAEWLARRRRIQGPLQRFGVAVNPHHRYVLAAERAMFASPAFMAAICISAMVRDDILRHFDVDPTRLPVIYSGVDAEKFSPAGRDAFRQQQRMTLKIPQQAPVALFVGSGFERKGLAGFLRALAEARGARAAVGEPWYGLVVGKDKHVEKYRALARRLGIAERVIFSGGVADARPFYAASDVFVLPTIYEPFGLVCLEALACGLPVVTSTSAGAAEIIDEGVNGYVTDALDTSAIARAMNAAIGNPAMPAAARERALAFSPTTMSAQYRALYRSLTGAA